MTDHDHPLDRPIRHALTKCQAHLATGDARAVRFRATVNLFGAAIDDPAVVLYAALGFRERRSMTFTVLGREGRRSAARD